MVTFLDHYESTDIWYTRKNISDQARRFERVLPGSSTILEVGCGSGIDSKYFLSMGHRVVSSDIGGNYTKLQCKCELLPFQAQTFSGIFARGVLHLCEIDTAVSEIRRVCKLGGIIFLSYPITLEQNGLLVDSVPIVNFDGWGNIIYKRISVKKYKDHRHTILQVLLNNISSPVRGLNA